eukprot:c10674_g1_i2.p1 GENE.c10674_g1_i2~~c10674_g1_i2.p1  ORF type:complete len:167 (+),score=30.14 c10674_g1_i2:25-525(+)
MWRAVCGLLFVCIVLQAQATDQTSTKPAQKKDKDDDEKPKPQKSELSKMFDSFGQGISEGVTKLGAEGKRALDKFQYFVREGLEPEGVAVPGQHPYQRPPSSQGFEVEWPQPWWWTRPPPWQDEIPGWFNRYIQVYLRRQQRLARSKGLPAHALNDPLGLYPEVGV